MGIKGTIRGGSGAGRGDNPNYTWHPSMGTPSPQESGAGGGGKKPPKTIVDTGDEGKDPYENVYDFNDYFDRRKPKDNSEGYYD